MAAGDPERGSGGGGLKAGAVAVGATSKLRLRFSLWQNRLPVDSLPLEGWIELQVLSEGDSILEREPLNVRYGRKQDRSCCPSLQSLVESDEAQTGNLCEG